MKTNLLRFLSCFVMLGFTAVAAWAQTQAGIIKAAMITGSVSLIAADGTTTALTDGARVKESDTIVTGDAAGVVLVFMNGSSVKLGANTRLAVEEFKMDPLAADIAVGQLTKEPSASQTKLNLAYGEMIGDVKKLNKASRYSIKTVAGAAGIRGTTYRVLLKPDPSGQGFTFQLSTGSGVVVFTGTTATVPVEVAAGKEVEVSAEVNPATGQASNVQIKSQDISPEAAQSIQTATADIMKQAQEQTVFTPKEQTTGDAAKTDKTTQTDTTPQQEAAGSDTTPSPSLLQSSGPQTNTPTGISPSN